MKAIVMAGGAGERLRPVTARIPKPMVKVAGRPVLEHIIRLLKANGIEDICMTLRYLPGVITDYFGDGRELGVRLQSRIEKEPLGTAGGVRACSRFLAGEDCLVISGDGMCDFALDRCIQTHYEREADVSLVLCRRKKPLEYGVVVTDRDGWVRQFVEKPTWDMVYSNCVNTGIYILSHRVVQEIPAGRPFDFSRDLFPRLLQEGRRMLGITAEGYWCDIGSPEAYHRCCMDALRGEIRGLAQPGAGIKSGTDITHTDAVLLPPVRIGRGVILGKNAKIGPNVIIGDNSSVCSGAVVRNTVMDGAVIHENASVAGSILLHGASVGCSAVIEDGAVIGENAVIGRGCLIASGVKVWPDREIPAGQRVLEDVKEDFGRTGLRFDGEGVIQGEWNITARPEQMMALGSALAGSGTVAVGHTGGDGAAVLEDALVCGVKSAGGHVIRTDCCGEAQMNFAGGRLGAAISVFIRLQEEQCRLSAAGENGAALSPEQCRRIEAAVRSGGTRVPAGGTGDEFRAAGMDRIYMTAAAEEFGAPGKSLPAFCLTGRGAENRMLRQILEGLGCQTRAERGAPVRWEVQSGGLGVSAVDESGRAASTQEMFLTAAYAALQEGEKTLAAADGLPGVQELCRTMGAACLGAAEGEPVDFARLYRRQRFLYDGVFAAVRIAGYMSRTGRKLSRIRTEVPPFATVEREVELKTDRAGVMRSLAENAGENAVFGRGVLFTSEKGTVSVTPCFDREAIRIVSSARREELAKDLCGQYERRTRELEEKAGRE